MPARSTLPALALTFATVTAATVPAARSAPASAAEAPAYHLTLDARAAVDSPLGRLIFEQYRRVQPEVDGWNAYATETLGLDLTRDVGVVPLSSDRDDLTDLQLVAELGDHPGKLEGWMLTLPGYASEDLDDQNLLHTFDLEFDRASNTDFPVAPPAGADPAAFHREREAERRRNARSVRVFATVPQTADGRFRFVASPDRDRVMALTAAAENGDALTEARDELRGDRVLAFGLSRLPEALLDQTEGEIGAAAWQSIRGVDFALGSGERLNLDLNLTTSSPARARQLQQLLSGLVGMAQFYRGTAEDPAQASELLGLLNELQIDAASGDADARGVTGQPATPGVSVRLDVPQQRIDRWVERGLMPNLQ